MTNTELRKTAWYLVDDNGNDITIDGHTYFTDAIARQLGREHGIIPQRASGTALKTTVVAR